MPDNLPHQVGLKAWEVFDKLQFVDVSSKRQTEVYRTSFAKLLITVEK